MVSSLHDLTAAVSAVEQRALAYKQRLNLAHTYLLTAEGLYNRAKSLNAKDAAILRDAAEDLERKAEAIYAEAGEPNPEADHMVVVAAGFFGHYPSPVHNDR